MPSGPKTFPYTQFELLVRSYLDKLVEREVVHQFAIAHIDDEYLPEFQRPVEDLHLMFLPQVRHDAEAFQEHPQIRYLLDVLDLLKSDVAQFGADTIRQREIDRMAGEDPSKHAFRAEYRDRHRRQ
jgi:hypothetical protein